MNDDEDVLFESLLDQLHLRSAGLVSRAHLRGVIEAYAPFHDCAGCGARVPTGMIRVVLDEMTSDCRRYCDDCSDAGFPFAA